MYTSRVSCIIQYLHLTLSENTNKIQWNDDLKYKNENIRNNGSKQNDKQNVIEKKSVNESCRFSRILF